MIPSSKFGHILRLVGWNALLVTAGLALVALTGEAYLRSTVPFRERDIPKVFVPGVGPLRLPDTDIYWTNHLDFWSVSRTNSLGFLDRVPPSPERAAESCHIAIIGDSFVEAVEVSIPEKFQVRLEEMAARELPHLDVTTSAFGMGGTGQINQLAFYDEYVRHLRPNLVVLVFVSNDYVDNFPLWNSIWSGLDPEHQAYVSAVRAEDGSFRLRPPDPDYRRFLLPRISGSLFTPPLRSFVHRIPLILQRSYFGARLFAKWTVLFSKKVDTRRKRVARTELLSQWPARAPLLDRWRPVSKGRVPIPPTNEDFPTISEGFQEGNASPFYKEALAFTAFGLGEFKERTERDGSALAIMAIHRIFNKGRGTFTHLSEIAAEQDIPLISQLSTINRYGQGVDLSDLEWAHDPHWTPSGHRWAAKALLEYLKQNQDVCE